MPKSILPQVKNIVFLMLENRSLDSVLGWLYSWPGHSSTPDHVYPAGSPRAYDGLQPGRFTNPAQGGSIEHPVVPVPTGLGDDQDRIPIFDPHEELKSHSSWNGVLNQLFGDEKTISAIPTPSLGPAKMRGFLQDYYSTKMAGEGLDILWTYPPDQLTVLNGLARQFAVSDQWFSSAPTQTNPNRAFSLCGTSLGRENNALLAIEEFKAPTVINYLAKAGTSWGLYFQDPWLGGKSYTEYTFPEISRAGGELGKIDQFLRRANEGTLPDFTYLEPKWSFKIGPCLRQGNDYHPPARLGPAEQFLRMVTEAVMKGKQWSQTLLIVTFDEHGGTYDHVAPPWGAINPDGQNGSNGFKFDLFGVRVPTLLISPFVKPQTVFRAPSGSLYPFDHTSFIKTLLLWAGVDLGMVKLGARMLQAPTFQDVLSLDLVNPSRAAPSAAFHLDGFSHGGCAPAATATAECRLGKLLDGIGFAAVKAILAKGNMAEIQTGIELYRRDPEKFERELRAVATVR